MAIVFDISDFIVLDESKGDNSSGTASESEDNNDNDSTAALPSGFSDALTALDATYDFATFPGDLDRLAEKAKSSGGYLDISTGGSLLNVAWTDADGNLLNGASSGLFVGVDEILLHTYSGDDNVVFGVIAGTSTIAFAAYLEDIGGGSYDIWMTTYTAIAHGDPTDPDDREPISANELFISAFESIKFDLDTLASGQNDWNRFGDFDAPVPGEDSYQIIVLADEVEDGQTVNTSKGGGDTTIGNSNQLMNGEDPAKDADGESMVFTFVKNSASQLLAGSTADTSTINYTDLQSANKGQWTISQTQGGSLFAEATMSAWFTSKETGSDFVTGLEGDEQIRITSVSVAGVGIDGDATAAGAQPFTATYEGDVFDGIDNVIDMGTRTIGNGKNAKIFDVVATFNEDGSVTVVGLVAKDVIGYETLDDHNRLKLQNTGNDASTLPWDIGGFELLDAGRTTVDVGPQLIIEDAGPDAGEAFLGAVQEDALTSANSNANSVGLPDDPADTVTRSIDLFDVVVPGTDAPAQFSLVNDGSGPVLSSKSETVTYNLNGDVLTASAGGREVFTLTLSGSTLTFVLKDQVDHTGTGDEETLSLDLTEFIAVADAEGDPGAFSGAVTITIENDVPEDSGSDIVEELAEDALGNGNPDVPADATDVTMQSGNLSSIVTPGADEDVTWSFAADLSGLPADLTSAGYEVTWSINLSGDLVAVADGAEILSLALESDGAYTLTLLGQFDHSGAEDDEEEIEIDFSSALVATDEDGDAVTPAASSFVIQIENDLPTADPEATQVTGAVQEDALDPIADTDDQSTGIEDVPADTDKASGGAGTITALFSSGADAPVETSLKTTIEAGDLPELYSKGVLLTYVSDGTTLTASAGARTVFTLAVNLDGSWSFDLEDQLDHVSDSGDDSIALVGAATGIDFSAILVATDADDDSVTGAAASKFVITIENDVPEASGQTTSSQVDEDELTGGITDTDSEDTTASGSVAALVSAGADEAVTWSLSLATTGIGAYFSGGEAVSWTSDGTTLTGSTTTGGAVFTLVMNSDGTYDVTLSGQFDHTGAAINDDDELLTLDLSSLLIATDFDGDSTGVGTGAFTVGIENDIPVYTPEVEEPIDPIPFDDASTFTGDLNGDNSADEPPTYTFTDADVVGTDPLDVIGIVGLEGAVVDDGTRAVWFVDATEDGYTADDTDWFEAVMNGDGTYTFNVLRDPEPAELNFSFDGFPAGNQIYGAFGSEQQTSNTDPTVSSALLVIPDGVDLKANGTLNSASSTTLNSSKSDGSTTALAVSNNSINPGQTLNFVSVTSVPSTIVVGQSTFDGSNYKDGDTLSFAGLTERTAASFEVAQTTPSGSFVDVKVTAIDLVDTTTVGAANDVAYIEDPDAAVYDYVQIETVVIYDAPKQDGGTAVAQYTFDDGTNAFIEDFDITGIMDVVVDGDGIKVINVADDFEVAWTQAEGADLWKIQNADTNGDGMDIGGFNFAESQPTPDHVLQATVRLTDSDFDYVEDAFQIIVDGTGIYDDIA